MRELFVNPSKKAPSTASRDYLRFRGRSPGIQIAMYDEFERLGTEQLLRSRGARILKFDGFDAKPGGKTLNPNADVIVISGCSDIGGGIEQFDQVIAVAASVPNARILVICPLNSAPWAMEALNHVPTTIEILIRVERLNAEELLVATRRLIFDDVDNRQPGPSPAENGRVLAATSAISNLSPREDEILSLVATGLSNNQIAKQLGISLRTVNNHVGMVFVKLDVNRDPATSARVAVALAYCSYQGFLSELPVAGIESDQVTTTTAALTSLSGNENWGTAA